MKNQTHYFFSLGLINLFGLYYIKEITPVWICFCLSFLLAGVCLLPNFLDNFAGANYSHRHVRRCRHPLAHSPYTLGYFLPLNYLRDKVSNPFFDFLVFTIALSWTSHIFLDSLNPEGIPIGRKPIFSNHLSKHYKWDLIEEEVRSIKFAKIPFNSLKANKAISRIGLFFLTMNLSNLIINYSQLLEVIL